MHGGINKLQNRSHYTLDINDKQLSYESQIKLLNALKYEDEYDYQRRSQMGTTILLPFFHRVHHDLDCQFFHHHPK